jgi:hypothetical protein
MSHGTHQAFAYAVRDMAFVKEDPGFRAETLCWLQIAFTLCPCYLHYFQPGLLESGP